MSQIDHEERAESRLLTQFKESPVLIDYIKALLSEANPLEQVFCDMLEQRTVDDATGFTQDIIGILVGQPRVLTNATLLTYFGYKEEGGPNPAGTGGYGDLNAPVGDYQFLNTEQYEFQDLENYEFLEE